MSPRITKKATAEAASTWPTLDKSRKDLAIIAREFGFAAYLSEDFKAAKTYGEAAVTSGVAEDPELRAGSEILLRLAEHKLAPSKVTRDRIYAGLETRMTLPRMDLISFFATQEVTAFDFKRGDWKDAVASAGLSSKLSAEGGELYLPQHFQFDLSRAVAQYMIDKQRPAYDDLGVLKQRIIDAINLAQSDAKAEKLVEIYWDTHAWHTSLGSHLRGRFKLKRNDTADAHEELLRNVNDRAVRLLKLRAEGEACQLQVDLRRNLEYPKSALYQGLIGTVILQVDIDEEGKSSNPKILSAVPEKYFGETVLRGIKEIRHKPDDDWGPDCSIARHGRVVTFVFQMG